MHAQLNWLVPFVMEHTDPPCLYELHWIHQKCDYKGFKEWKLQFKLKGEGKTSYSSSDQTKNNIPATFYEPETPITIPATHVEDPDDSPITVIIKLSELLAISDRFLNCN